MECVFCTISKAVHFLWHREILMMTDNDDNGNKSHENVAKLFRQGMILRVFGFKLKLVLVGQLSLGRLTYSIRFMSKRIFEYRLSGHLK